MLVLAKVNENQIGKSVSSLRASLGKHRDQAVSNIFSHTDNILKEALIN